MPESTRHASFDEIKYSLLKRSEHATLCTTMAENRYISFGPGPHVRGVVNAFVVTSLKVRCQNECTTLEMPIILMIEVIRKRWRIRQILESGTIETWPLCRTYYVRLVYCPTLKSSHG